jgi:hypothetical protein
MSLHAHVFLQRTPGSHPEPIGQLEVEPLPPGTRATNSARDERGAGATRRLGQNCVMGKDAAAL